MLVQVPSVDEAGTVRSPHIRLPRETLLSANGDNEQADVPGGQTTFARTTGPCARLVSSSDQTDGSGSDSLLGQRKQS